MEDRERRIKQADIKKRTLKNRYERFVEDFGEHKDDRLLFTRRLQLMLEACDAMANVENNTIWVAFNEYVEREKKSMNEIVHRFTGLQWNNAECKWK